LPKPKARRNWLFWELLIGGLVCVNVPILLLPSIRGQPLDSQTTYYSILAVGLALIIAALVEHRMDILERKIDELVARD
jgi:hypothetical protein